MSADHFGPVYLYVWERPLDMWIDGSVLEFVIFHWRSGVGQKNCCLLTEPCVVFLIFIWKWISQIFHSKAIMVEVFLHLLSPCRTTPETIIFTGSCRIWTFLSFPFPFPFFLCFLFYFLFFGTLFSNFPLGRKPTHSALPLDLPANFCWKHDPAVLTLPSMDAKFKQTLTTLGCILVEHAWQQPNVFSCSE